ncbi:MAG: hypothetical protein HGA75_04605 [Thiobacillus sp.]|nr:hypothetical protein [Thiobacillus sp.]
MFRALLALDGTRLTPNLLTVAAKRCVHLAERLDILLVNPPKAPTRLLWGLLVHLENSGVDYRLASIDGDLGEQVLTYLKRFLGINIVLVDEVALLEQSISADMAHLRAHGYRFVSINEFCQG